MKNTKDVKIYLLMIVYIAIVLIGCKKNETAAIIKKDPVITWANPADITDGTFLGPEQLNAVGDVIGKLVYTPGNGTKLNVGDNQQLTVTINPYDWMHWNSVSKTVTINVLHGQTQGDGGKTTVVFNPNLTYGVMFDGEGNSYKTIQIGTQTWMAENLRVTRYRNGENITEVSDYSKWPTLSSAAYCCPNGFLDSDVNNIATYGRLYNWIAATDARNIAPTGWHVPSNAEWITLVNAVGGKAIQTDNEAIAGNMLREIGNKHWVSGALISTDDFGFSAVGAGYVSKWNNSPYYARFNEVAFWWTTDSGDAADQAANCYQNICNPQGVFRLINCFGPNISQGTLTTPGSISDDMQDGLSIRLVKDN